MIPADFNKLVEDRLNELKKERSTLFKQMKADTKLKPNSGQLSTFYIFKKHEVDIKYMDIRSLEETIREFKLETKQYAKQYSFYQHIDIMAEDDNAYVILQATWYEQRKEDDATFAMKAKEYAKSQLRTAVIDHLKLSEPQARSIYIECKIVKLWLDGSIDFDTFCTITTANYGIR